MMRLIFYRELRLAWRSGVEILNPLWFFLLVMTLFPFALGTAPQTLKLIAPGVVWVTALLASLLVTDRLFRDDWQDGSLEQLLLLPLPLPVVSGMKMLAHWVTTGVPLLLLVPIAGVMMGLPWRETGVLMLTLLLGTPTLSFIGAVGAGLTVGLGRGGILLNLLILPFTVPLLIFSMAAVNDAAAGLSFTGDMAILGALLSASLALCPFATAMAIRLTIQ